MIENQNGSIPVAYPAGLINATGCGSTLVGVGVCVCLRESQSTISDRGKVPSLSLSHSTRLDSTSGWQQEQ